MAARGTAVETRRRFETVEERMAMLEASVRTLFHELLEMRTRLEPRAKHPRTRQSRRRKKNTRQKEVSSLSKPKRR